MGLLQAALNMVTRCTSIDMCADEILNVALNPGSVKTDMNSQHGQMEPSESVRMMVTTIFALNETHNGKFVNYRCEFLRY